MQLNNERKEISKKIPIIWNDSHNEYKKLAVEKKKAVTKYRKNVDTVYENVQITKKNYK